MVSSLWEESDSELELPPEWQEVIQTDGFILYRNPTTGGLQRTHPISGQVKRVSLSLPPDWYMSTDYFQRTVFVNSANGRISYADPRLATASVPGLNSLLRLTNSRLDRFSVVDETLLSKDLRGRYILVTGSSCGLGLLIATKLADRGATVFCACSMCPSNARPLLEHTDFYPATTRNLESGLFWLPCDLGNLRSVVQCGKVFDAFNIPLHVCILASDCFPSGASCFSLGSILNKLSTICGRLIARVSFFYGSFHPILLHKFTGLFSADSCDCHLEFSSSGCTADGFEIAMQKNYLAQVLLLRCVSRSIAQAGTECNNSSGRPRIVILSGDSHRYAPLGDTQGVWPSYSMLHSNPSTFISALSQYATTKLFQFSFLFELQHRIQKWHQKSLYTGYAPLLCACNAENLLAVRCYGLWYRSLLEFPCNSILLLLRLFRWFFSLFLQSLAQAAAIPCFCAADASLTCWRARTRAGTSQHNLLYLDTYSCQPPSSYATNKTNSRVLWEHTNSILDRYDGDSSSWSPLIGPDLRC